MNPKEMKKKVLKINKRFSFSDKIDMRKYSKDGDIYDLYSVIVHSGSANNGHYYCFIKDESDKWFKFNDTSVTIASLSDVIDDNFGGDGKNYSAYLLFYVKNGSKNEIFFEVSENLIPERVKNKIKLIQQKDTNKECYELKVSTSESISMSCSAGYLSYNKPMFSIFVKKSSSTIDVFNEVTRKIGCKKEELRLFGVNLDLSLIHI